MNDRNGYVTAAIPWVIRQGEFMYAHLTGTSLPILTRPHTSYAHVLRTAVGTRCKNEVTFMTRCHTFALLLLRLSINVLFDWWHGPPSSEGVI